MKEFWQDLKQAIRTVPDFPIPGIQFRDITSLIENPLAFNKALVDLTNVAFQGTKIIGIESRGFVFGAPLARDMDVPFIMARKPGKLPNETYKKEYQLEYGTAKIELQCDCIHDGEKIIIIDDLCATGGTVLSVINTIQKNWKANILAVGCLVDLPDLGGSERIKSLGIPFYSAVEYQGT